MDFKSSLLSRIDDKIITEAFSEASMSKVLDLIGKYLTKTFGSQAKWINDSEVNSVVVGGQKFWAVSYFFANGSEMRIGFRQIISGSFSVARIDYWKPGFTKLKFNAAGIPIADFTVTFEKDISVMQIFPKILPALKTILTTKSGAKSYDIMITQKGAENLTEGKKDYVGSKSQIIRNMLKNGETRDAIYALVGNDASAKSMVSKIGKELGIVITAKVTPNGNRNETKSPAASAQIKKGYKLVPKYSDVNTVYEDLESLLDAVLVKKKFNALVVSGSTGTGKTQNVMNFLNDHGLQGSDGGAENADYMIIKGGNVSALAMYQNMFMFREKGKLILIDDADAAFDDATKNNLLKAALDSYDARFISWETKNPNIFKVNGKVPIEDGDDTWTANIDDGKYPNRFKYEGQIIIISNKQLYDFDAAVRGRCVCVDITIKSEDMLNRIESLIDSGKSFSGANKVTMEKALTFMKKLPGNNKRAGEFWPGTEYSKEDYILVKEDEMDVNFRTYMTVVKFADLGFSDAIWQRLAIKYAGIPAKLLEGGAPPAAAGSEE